MEILGKTQIDFIGKRRIVFCLSAFFSALGLLAAVQIARGAANLGIDFTGGTSVQLKFEKPVSLARVREALITGGLRDAEPQQFAGGDRVLIRVKTGEVGPGGVADQIRVLMEQAFAGNTFLVEGSTEIGPAIGRELQKKALLATALSFAGIILYIAYRFEFKFGIAATVATFHDVLVILGLFFVLGREINLLIVTALLTLAGYSLSDTVVVYDRIRENLRGRRRESLADIINTSINEVLSRTCVTGITVLLVLLALFFLGGEVLHDFALTLLLGVLVGTYSSWFVASPIVYVWRTQERVSRR